MQVSVASDVFVSIAYKITRPRTERVASAAMVEVEVTLRWRDAPSLEQPLLRDVHMRDAVRAYTPTSNATRPTKANCAHAVANGEMERHVLSTATPSNCSAVRPRKRASSAGGAPACAERAVCTSACSAVHSHTTSWMVRCRAGQKATLRLRIRQMERAVKKAQMPNAPASTERAGTTIPRKMDERGQGAQVPSEGKNDGAHPAHPTLPVR